MHRERCCFGSYPTVGVGASAALETLRRGGAIVWHDYAVKSRRIVLIAEFSLDRPVVRIRKICLIV
jgi:hypothetical protein